VMAWLSQERSDWPVGWGGLPVISRSGVVGASNGAESDELLVVKWMTCRGGVGCLYIHAFMRYGVFPILNHGFF